MNELSTKQIIGRIILIIASAELLIMFAMALLAFKLGLYTRALVDTILLTLLSAPAIYVWVIKPFVEAREEALTEIRRLAYTDPLTHLANRRLIANHLGKAIAGSVRHRDYGAVLLIDLDGFKPVNDTYGHEAGDAILIEFAERLRTTVRSEDVVGRLGGDEFIILVHRLGADRQLANDKALKLVGKLIDVVNRPFIYQGQTVHVGASIGIRLLGLEQMDTETAIREADMAMYRAKQAGKGRAVIFES